MKFIRAQKPDSPLALVIFALVVFGIVMVFSASSVISYERFGRNDVYLIRQLISFGIGLAAWVIFQNIDYHYYRKIATPLLLVTLLLLILVFIPGIGHSWRGVSRWIGIGSVVFQPAEITKLTLILYLSAWFERMNSKVANFKSGFLPFALLVLILGVLLIEQPDFGSFIVLTGIAVAIYFLAGASISHLILGMFSAFLGFCLLIKVAPYRISRLLSFINPENDPLGIAYHIRNALIAIGSGGLWGLGFGQSRQKYLFLPEVHTDSIFAIISEELGFLRASLIIIAFFYIAYRGYKIAQKAPDTFGRLVAVGIVTWFVFQAFINIAGITGLLPFTGVPLPFISYGGTSLVINLVSTGILLNISKYSK
ncbi:MAG: putative lipid II flippase FtsW [Candidatus Berkelbacteria bacterium]|nr:putative lipid II flippase FtsW [Candidatus Berkelbacteria bacterium]